MHGRGDGHTIRHTGPGLYTFCLSPHEDRSALLVDISESDDAIIVEGSVPGARREDIDITLVGNVVNIQVRPRPSPRPQPGKQPKPGQRRYVRRERYAAGWRRAIELPMGIDPDALTWSVVLGVLTLRIRKPTSKLAPEPASAAECAPGAPY
jgi:HSP20 family molecular chaperone IbpA